MSAANQRPPRVAQPVTPAPSPLTQTWSVAFVEAKEEKVSPLSALRRAVSTRLEGLRPAAQHAAQRVVTRAVAIAAPAAVALLASQAVHLRREAQSRQRALARTCEPEILEAKAEPAGPGLLKVVVQVVVQRPPDRGSR